MKYDLSMTHSFHRAEQGQAPCRHPGNAGGMDEQMHRASAVTRADPIPISLHTHTPTLTHTTERLAFNVISQTNSCMNLRGFPTPPSLARGPAWFGVILRGQEDRISGSKVTRRRSLQASELCACCPLPDTLFSLCPANSY